PEGTVEALRRRVDRALSSLLRRELDGVAEGAAEAVRHAVLSPGKRVRPSLVVAAYRAAGGSGKGIGELACSVELVHAYSLVHDDLPCMDDDVLRRGRPTLHVRVGARRAAFVGAALMPLAARAVRRSSRELGLGGERGRRLLRILCSAAGARGMVGGQLRDLRAEGRTVDRSELEEIHRRKTAALIAAAVRMGAVAARADRALVERLSRFGRRLGLAFQAVDDILDVTGDAGELGKDGGRDRDLGKATYPSVLGLGEAERVSRELAAAARAELDGLDGTATLEALTDFVVERRR
ncbi:MAG: polyprenyl synthetase family protein, partial [Gemmatimonadota bacterium]